VDEVTALSSNMQMKQLGTAFAKEISMTEL
jgi:hypothetical protein